MLWSSVRSCYQLQLVVVPGVDVPVTVVVVVDGVIDVVVGVGVIDVVVVVVAVVIMIMVSVSSSSSISFPSQQKIGILSFSSFFHQKTSESFDLISHPRKRKEGTVLRGSQDLRCAISEYESISPKPCAHSTFTTM